MNMPQQTKNELQLKFLETLKQTYKDANTTILSTRPPKDNQTVQNMMFPIADIDNILINNMKAVLSVAVYDLRINTINITATATSEYYYEFIPEMIPKITYGIVSITSKYILSQMQLYMDKSFIFAYIKERIVRPNIKAELDIILQDVLKDSVVKTDLYNHKIMEEDIQNMIYELMISYDSQKFISILSKYRNKPELNDSIIAILNDSKIFVPNFIYDIFTNNILNDELSKRLEEFFKEYYYTNTNDAIIDLFKRYATKTVGLVDVTKHTIAERSDYNGLNNLMLIDGVTFLVLKVINKILALQDISEDEETLIKEDVIATSIRTIVNKYKAYGVTFRIDNNAVIIKDSNNKETNIPYREKTQVNNIDNPFTIFGINSKAIESTFNRNPDKSPLTQTGITTVEEKNLFLNNKSIKTMFTDINYRISHRRRKIAELKSKYSTDTNLITEVDFLLNRVNNYKYMDIYKNSIYILQDERKLLLTLAEIEGIYRKIENYKAKEETNDTKAAKS